MTSMKISSFSSGSSFANSRVDTIIAPTGTFFEPFQINVNNPLLTSDTQDLLQLIEDFEDDGDGLANVALGRRLVELAAATA